MNTDRGMSNANTVKWTSLPIAEEPLSKTLVLFCIVLAFFTAASFTFSLSYGMATLVLLLLSLVRYFFPTSYEISEKGITVSFFIFKRHRDWNTYLRYALHKDGIYLSPFKTKSRLDSFRGDFLKFNKDSDPIKVLTTIKKYVP